MFSSLQGVDGLKIEQLLRMMSDEEKPPAPPLRNTSNQGHNKVRHSNFNFLKTQLETPLVGLRSMVLRPARAAVW